MNEHPILGQVVLGYSPMIDRQRTVTATRLTVFPVRPDLALDAAALLQALAEVWPADGGCAGAQPGQRRPAARQPGRRAAAELCAGGAGLHGRRPAARGGAGGAARARQPRCTSRAGPAPNCRARCWPASSIRSSSLPTTAAPAPTRRAARRAAWARAVGRDPRLRGGGELQARRGRGAGLADRRGGGQGQRQDRWRRT